MSIPFRIVNRYRDLLRGDIHLPENPADSPVAIICHGFKGFKDWGGFPCAAEHLALKGITALRFNFSLNGVEEDFMNFTALHRFARNTISRELEDLGDILDAIENGDIIESDVDRTRIAVIGHSLGGGVAVVKAAEDHRIRGVVSWAGVADFMRWGKKTRQVWRQRGRMEIQNVRTGQTMPMDVVMLDDMEKNVTRFDIPAAGSRLTVPLLAVHGEQDVSVPIEEGKRIVKAAPAGLATFHAIPNTDHTFGVRHPFEGVTESFRFVLDTTAAWLHRNLR
ncbi:MAG: prolyl oligopeptidase family serine peptidase [Bacteroidetes bacterium]|nr:prolyl oligopeptidase family serine peptidase [Bacteroidota bacterium]